MALSAGDRLGPYEILGPLGAGGMGEVYRARDSRLDRTVAVKVLPSETAADPQLIARFEREARAIAALAHPNICTLHDVGQEDGRTFLVMEHLVGETLAERLGKRPLPLSKALEVGAQIADALSAAHKQGIIHRDLKPGNVMLTKTGARLLDFGLARLASPEARAPVESLSSAPTVPGSLTGTGTVMGTLPYMAPEQIEGREADARTDLWALGMILYEMLTGRRPFEGSSPASLAGAILERDPPPLTERQPGTPPSLERLVRRCLAKDPDDRWDTAHDVGDELRWIAEAGPAADASPARSAPRWVIPALVAGVAAALLLGALAGWIWPRPSEEAGAAQVVRTHLDLTADRPLLSVLWLHPTRTELALSPDGTLLAWTSRPDDDPTHSGLYLRRMDTGEVTRVPGTEGGSQPFFSPDGRWLGFNTGVRPATLRKVSVEAGLPVDLADLSARPMGVTWAPDGRIFMGSRDGGIRWVPAEGGLPREVTAADSAHEVGHRLPSVLPGGRELGKRRALARLREAAGQRPAPLLTRWAPAGLRGAGTKRSPLAVRRRAPDVPCPVGPGPGRVAPMEPGWHSPGVLLVGGRAPPAVGAASRWRRLGAPHRQRAPRHGPVVEPGRPGDRRGPDGFHVP